MMFRLVPESEIANVVMDLSNDSENENIPHPLHMQPPAKKQKKSGSFKNVYQKIQKQQQGQCQQQSVQICPILKL